MTLITEIYLISIFYLYLTLITINHLFNIITI